MADDAAFQVPTQITGAPPAAVWAVPVTATGRRRLTRADFVAMMKAGVIDEGERTELVDGELLVMPSEGAEHDDDLETLHRVLDDALRPAFRVSMRGPLNIGDATQLGPDLSVWPAATRGWDKVAEKLSLAVEISRSSLRKDLGPKALLYAAASVPEYWVLDVEQRRLWVHRGPLADGWRERVLLEGSVIAPLCAPDAPVDLSGLLGR